MCDKSKKEKCPEGEELERFFEDPEHCFARLARDISEPEVVYKNMGVCTTRPVNAPFDM
jgi:hypothetical protein